MFQTQKMRFRVDVDNNSVTTQGNSTKNKQALIFSD